MNDREQTNIQIGKSIKKEATKKAATYELTLSGLVRLLLVKFIKNPSIINKD